MDQSLSFEFSTERLKRYLQQHPEEAARLAVDYFEDFSQLALDFKQLERDFKVLQLQHLKLQAQQEKLVFFHNNF